MNNVFTPPPQNFQNSLRDLLARMDGQDLVNRENLELNRETYGLLKDLMETQRKQGESIAKITLWIDSQQK